MLVFTPPRLVITGTILCWLPEPFPISISIQFRRETAYVYSISAEMHVIRCRLVAGISSYHNLGVHANRHDYQWWLQMKVLE